MYQYTAFDREFVKLRAQQFRDQLERWQRGELTDEQLLPLRLQNGWYIQRYAPMARPSVPAPVCLFLIGIYQQQTIGLFWHKASLHCRLT